MKLWVRLALLFMVLGIAPLLILGHFAYRRGQAALLSEAESHLASVAVLKEDALLEWIEGNTALLESVAARPLVAELSLQLATIQRGTPGWAASHDRLTDSHLAPNIMAGIEDLSVLHPESGRILASTDQILEGRFRESEEFFLRGRVETFIDHVRYVVTAESLTLHLSTPIRTASGELVAVLSAHVDLEEMGRIVRLTSGAHDSQDIYLINEAALFVTEPKFGEGYALRRMLNTEGAHVVISGASGVAQYVDYRGIEVLGTYRWIDSLSMGLIVETDRSEVLQPMRTLGLAVVVGEIIAAVAVLLFAVLFSRGIVRPIHRLKAGADEIGRGNLAFKMETRGQHEIAQLGQAFNRMTDNLRQITASRDELNREVQARTAAELRLHETIRALEQSESQFRLLSDASPVGVFMFQDMKLLYVNPVFERIFGYSGDELIGKIGPLDITDPAQHQDTGTYIAQCFAGIPDLPPFPFRGIRKDGSIVYCEAMARPIDYQGAPALLGTITDTTKRREAEAELRLKDTVFESSIAANSTADIHGIINHVNPAFVRTWGYASKDEILGRPISDFLAIDKEALAIITQLNETGEWEGDFVGLRKDGSTFISNGHATVIQNEDGEMVGYQSANLDVTDQRQAEAELLQSKETTDAIIQALPGTFYQISAEGRFVRWNRTFTQVTGYSDAEMRELHPLDLFEGEDKALIGTEIAKVFSLGHGEATADFVTKEGARIPYYFTGILKQLDGAPYLVGMGTDISELRSAEQAALENEEKYRALVETTPDAIWEVDSQMCYTYVSPRMSELIGYAPDELLGTSPFDLIPPEKIEGIRQHFGKYLADHLPFSGIEVEPTHKDGRRVVISASATPIVGPSGEFLGYRGTDRDITDRKLAEERLEKLLEELQRSNEELERFAYVASHDLQEPLRMVASYTQLLERRYRDALDEDARDFIGFAVDGASRMQRLINDLLAFSRVQTRGKAFEPVDLAFVLGQARANLEAVLDESDARISKDDLPTLPVDESQMVSVFQNLISNAIKFRSTDNPRIHIGATDQGGSWEFSVRDNGIGISPDFFERIFVIFQRLHTRDEYPGTGIGLALCKRIIERHGGEISVESKQGQGSTFRFTLPKEHAKEVV